MKRGEGRPHKSMTLNCSRGGGGGGGRVVVVVEVVCVCMCVFMVDLLKRVVSQADMKRQGKSILVQNIIDAIMVMALPWRRMSTRQTSSGQHSIAFHSVHAFPFLPMRSHACLPFHSIRVDCRIRRLCDCLVDFE